MVLALSLVLLHTLTIPPASLIHAFLFSLFFSFHHPSRDSSNKRQNFNTKKKEKKKKAGKARHSGESTINLDKKIGKERGKKRARLLTMIHPADDRDNQRGNQSKPKYHWLVTKEPHTSVKHSCLSEFYFPGRLSKMYSSALPCNHCCLSFSTQPFYWNRLSLMSGKYHL